MKSNLQDIFYERRISKKRFRNYRDKYSKQSKLDIPEGLYEKCPKCQSTISKKDLYLNLRVCPNCNFHFRITAIERIKIICDEDTFIEKGLGYITLDPLNIDNKYDEKIKKVKKNTSLDDAFIYGHALLKNENVVIGVLDSHFLMGSMGSVVGEKVTKAFEYARYRKLPIILFIASGGARMQEGIFSLMQMVKTSQEVAKFDEAKLLYISVLTHPTTGGVTASFASLGDIILAEPGALIGFAGPRVIEQTIKQKLPEGFQTSEFLQEKGFVDLVVKRNEMRDVLSLIINHHGGHKNEYY